MELQITSTNGADVWITEGYLSTNNEFLDNPTNEQVEVYFKLAETHLATLKESWRQRLQQQAA